MPTPLPTTHALDRPRFSGRKNAEKPRLHRLPYGLPTYPAYLYHIPYTAPPTLPRIHLIALACTHSEYTGSSAVRRRAYFDYIGVARHPGGGGRSWRWEEIWEGRRVWWWEWQQRKQHVSLPAPHLSPLRALPGQAGQLGDDVMG